jgi:hypothetical protein
VHGDDTPGFAADLQENGYDAVAPKNGEIIERLLYTDPVTDKKIKTEAEIPFYQAQDRQLMSQNHMVDPCSIEDYIVAGGYSALAKTLRTMVPEEIMSEIKSSGFEDVAVAAFRPGSSGTSAGKRPATRST